tara:strand:- start:26145 stop:26354 length:210 start_codon:yes stop_codon:yes gene_type:complete
MATVDKDLAMKIIQADGHYADDPRVQQVVKYTNAWGAESYAILYERDVAINRYAPSDYVINPEIIWTAK